MNMTRRWLWVLGLGLWSLACSLVTVAPTLTPIPTATPTSTLTPTLTSTPTPTLTPTSTQTSTPTETRIPPSIQVAVDGTRGWQNTGINLPLKTVVTIVYAYGKWTNNVAGEFVDAEGYADLYPRDVPGLCGQAPLPDERNGALIGRIGDAPAFHIGNQSSFTAVNEGFLFLRMNDAEACMNDNGGSVIVEITLK